MLWLDFLYFYCLEWSFKEWSENCKTVRKLLFFGNLQPWWATTTVFSQLSDTWVCTEQHCLDCTSPFSSPSLLFLQVFSCVLEHFWLPRTAVLNTMSWQFGTMGQVAMCHFALCMISPLSYMGTDRVAHTGRYSFANSLQDFHSISLLGLQAWECESGFVSLYPFRQFLSSIAAPGLFNICMCTEQMFVDFMEMQGCLWRVTQVEQMPSCWAVSHCKSVSLKQQSANRSCCTKAHVYSTGGKSGFLFCMVREHRLSRFAGNWLFGNRNEAVNEGPERVNCSFHF